MTIPFVIGNQEHRLAGVLNDLLARSAGTPLDVATAYFAASGYCPVKDGPSPVRSLPAAAGSGAADGGGRRLAFGVERHDPAACLYGEGQRCESFGPAEATKPRHSAEEDE
jgi:hypothetical protein